MSDHAERIIEQVTAFDDRATPMPRWSRAAREASFAVLRRFYRKAPPPTMYHYTSSAALMSIVANNELWLSDAIFLNDRHEVELGRTLACEQIAAKIAQESSSDVRAMFQRALDNFESWTDPQVYVACFSFEGDDLTQWRAYGGASAPVAIELEHSPLMFGYTSKGMLDRVLYDPDDQQWVIDGLLTSYADAYRKDVIDPIPFERNRPPLTRDEENGFVADSLYHALWRYIVTFKDRAFVSERELRFIYIAHDFSRSGTTWHPEHPKPRFRERSGRIIPYLSSNDLDFQNMKRIGEVPKLPIRSVRIGPTAEPALLERGIRHLLDTYDHAKATVAVSASPYRPS